MGEVRPDVGILIKMILKITNKKTGVIQRILINYLHMKKFRIYKTSHRNWLFKLVFISFLYILILPQFINAQMSKASIKLGAYYFGGWSGKCINDDGSPDNAWAKDKPSRFTKLLATDFAGREPVWGWREDKQEIMERQIDLAADNGISYFSFVWVLGGGEKSANAKDGSIDIATIENLTQNRPIHMFMDAKNNSRMEYCLLVTPISGTTAWKQAVDYWIHNYFTHPRYLCIDGRPLLMIYIPDRVNKDELAYLQETSRKAGFPGVAVVACRCCKGPEDGFQLQTRYNIKPAGTWSKEHPTSEKHSYKELMEANIKGWSGSAEQPLIPVVTQGWDSRPWEGTEGEYGLGIRQLSWYFEKAKPKEFRNLLKELIKWMDEHPTQITKDRLAIIYAWNEIGEGGWLVPCKDDPKGAYLKVIKDVIFSK